MKGHFFVHLAILLSLWISFGWISAEENASPLPADVFELTVKYDEAMKRANAPLIQLKDSYTSRLETLKTESQAKGNLEGVVAIQKELEQMKTAEPGTNNRFAPIQELQTVYHKHAHLASERVYPERHRIEKAYVGGLRKLVANYTRDGALDSAIAARRILQAAEERLAEWDRLAAIGMTSGNPIESVNWGKLGELISSERLETTTAVGGNTTVRPRDRDIQEEPALLVGFEVFFNPFGGSDKTVRGLIPLFRTESGKSISGLPRGGTKKGTGRRIVAKKGYVVGELEAASTNAVRKLKITFHRISGMGTDPDAEPYDSGWLGEWETGAVTRLSTDGKLPVGVDGFYGLGLDQLALIVVTP